MQGMKSGFTNINKIHHLGTMNLMFMCMSHDSMDGKKKI